MYKDERPREKLGNPDKPRKKRQRFWPGGRMCLVYIIYYTYRYAYYYISLAERQKLSAMRFPYYCYYNVCRIQRVSAPKSR